MKNSFLLLCLLLIGTFSSYASVKVPATDKCPAHERLDQDEIEESLKLINGNPQLS